ncbi:hypothetical protein ACQPWY_34190 [Pseudonocardia xinjiangensis]|uniref:hypothetical protein n=1 Tax=Pseudonocardia xinjiangensis TaxID=75289 RepID=UPI003D8B7FDA
MQKRLLIAAAGTVAAMLALTPLAFANDYARDDSGQRNQVNLCSSDQDVDVLPSTVVGAILPSVSQEQNGNCVTLADGVAAPSTTTPPTTTTPPPPGPTYETVSSNYLDPGQGTFTRVCEELGEALVSFSIVEDPAQIVTATAQLPTGVAVTYDNQTGSQQLIVVSLICESANPGNP